MGNPPLIEVTDLHRHFHMGRETVRALDGVNLAVGRAEFWGITGPSGSGKSTLLYLLGGLDHPTSGSIRVNGEEITALDDNGLAGFRQRSVGFVFQMFNLIPTMTALQNVEFPMLFARVPAPERRAHARALLERVGLGDRMGHRPTELSGGQQQRVAIARSLVNSPTILLADEPTGNLDSHSGADVIGLLQELNAEGRTIVLVSHDPAVIAATGRHVRLHDGRIQDEE
jgi:putative ABC transport system ATP-binding protein